MPLQQLNEALPDHPGRSQDRDRYTFLYISRHNNNSFLPCVLTPLLVTGTGMAHHWNNGRDQVTMQAAHLPVLHIVAQQRDDRVGGLFLDHKREMMPG